jgi:hypothetical protein
MWPDVSQSHEIVYVYNCKLFFMLLIWSLFGPRIRLNSIKPPLKEQTWSSRSGINQSILIVWAISVSHPWWQKLPSVPVLFKS